MRILLVNTRHFRGGGDSTYNFNLATLLRSFGHEVAFFAMKDPQNLPDPNDDIFVDYIDFRELNKNKNILTGLKVLKRVIYSSDAKKRISQLVDRFYPDIVHLQNIHSHISPSVVFEAKRRKLPVVWTLHDYKMICPNTHFLIDTTGEICEACGRNKYYQAILKRCKKGSILASIMASIEAYAHRLMHLRERVDLFLTPSVFLRTKLLELGFPPSKVVHLPHFLPDEMFHGNIEDKGYLLFMSKLDPIKGIFPLLEACERVPEVNFIFAGNIKETIEKHVQQVLPKNANYVGMKHGNELRKLLLGARAVILPSLWYENQPFSIIEAFAIGKPIITSDLGGMTELVQHGERGLLVQPGNVNALAEAIQLINRHLEKARQMGGKAQDYARKEHGAKNHYQRLMQIYNQALNIK